MLDRVDHIVLAVRDLEVATDTYARLLGREPSWRGTHPEGGTANSLFRLDNTYLELLSPEAPGASSGRIGAWLERNGEGIAALAFGTPDAERCAAELRRRGLVAADPIDGKGKDRMTGAVRKWRNVFLSPSDARGVNLFAIEHRDPPESLPPTPPRGEAPVAGVDHIVISSADPDAVIALYRDRLDIRLALDRTFEQWGMRLLFFRIGGVTLEIAHALGSGGSIDPDRLWGISWQVSDVDAARERLARDGFDVSEVRAGRRPGTRVCTVRRETHGVATLLLGPEK